MDSDHDSAFSNNLSHKNITRQYNPWPTIVCVCGGGGGGDYWCIPITKKSIMDLYYIRYCYHEDTVWLPIRLPVINTMTLCYVTAKFSVFGLFLLVITEMKPAVGGHVSYCK